MEPGVSWTDLGIGLLIMLLMWIALAALVSTYPREGEDE